MILSHLSRAALILLKNDFASIPVAIELGRLVFDNLKKVTMYLMPVSRICRSSIISADLILIMLQGGSYAQFMAILANVLLGMQMPLNPYQQTCYSITNDVIMSIPLMYEKPEWGGCSRIHELSNAHFLL